MELIEKDARYKWLISQMRWHIKQPRTAWHKSQIRHYRDAASMVYTFPEIVANAFKAKRAEFAKTLRKTNMLLFRLR